MQSNLPNMFIIKRNGQKQPVQFDKITNRISKLINKDEREKLIPALITQKVISSIFSGIKTEQIDIEAAKICANMVTTHPLYGNLAGRILVSDLHKKTKNSFVDKMNSINLMNPDLLDQEWLKWINNNSIDLEKIIDYSRDFSYDYFGFKTLERAYLIKDSSTGEIYERPQDMLLRVASFINMGNLDMIEKTYDLMSKGCYTHASPTLFNSGTSRSQLSSCFLLNTNDSIEGITKSWDRVSKISKWAGGIGLHVSNIRAKGSTIRGTNGPSSGIVPMLQVYNNIARYINQCFTEDTIIYTKNGPIQIKDIRVGDEIVTIDGSFQKINYVYTSEYNDNIIELNIKNNYKKTRVTNEHPFYVLKNQKKITNYSIIKNRLDKKLVHFEWCEAKNLTTDDLIVYPIPKYSEDISTYNENDCYIYGIMIGDGHICKNLKECGVTLGYKKERLINFVKYYLGQNNINYWESDNKQSNTVTIRWSYNYKFKFTRNQLYNSNDDKIVDKIFINLPDDKIIKIIKGVLETDGCIDKEITLELSSQQVIDSIRYMLMRLGILSSGYERDRIGNKSTYKDITTRKKIWVLRIPKVKIICDELNIESGEFQKYIKWGDYLLSRITSIEKNTYSGNIYDLNINNNHNYLLESGLVHNGGKRKGSFAIYLEPHHPDIVDFLELRKNTGSDEVRARDLFYALWVSDLFMKQVQEDNDWYFFCPDEAPGLNDVYGEEYETLYWKYVEEKRYKSTIKARKLMEQIMDSQLETGMPYMLYKDSINRKSNQKNIGVIKSSNLCAEIVEVSNDEEHAVCNLASIAVNHALESFKSRRTWTIYTKEDCKYCKWSKIYMDNKGYKYIEKTEFDEEINKFLSKKEDNFKVTYPQIMYGKSYIGGFEEMTKYTSDKYNHSKLYETAYYATVNLDKVIDKNYYPTPETKCSNMRNRPIGLGIQGLADTLARMKISFESEEAVEFNSKMMETIYFAALNASCDISNNRHLALEKVNMDSFSNIPHYYDKKYFVEGNTKINDDIPLDKNNMENKVYHEQRLNKEELSLKKNIGAYSKFEGSPISEGIFQQDMWGNTICNRDWEKLRERVKNYGIRNSLLTALMPTASTSQILGNNECFEWFTSNIYTRRTLAGDFPVINKYLVEDLINIGEWNEDVKNIIIADDGSVKSVKNIPTFYKNIYKTIWEIKQIWVLKHARARAPFVDQTQSMNIYMSVPDYKKLNSCHNWGWKNGLKTGMYYLRTNAAKGAIKFTIDPKLINKVNKNNEEEECYSCSA